MPSNIPKRYVIGNWKMAGSFEQIKKFSQYFKNLQFPSIEVALCPPFPYLSALQVVLHPTSIYLGAQDISTQSFIAATGQVSGQMLKELGCHYVLIGHSERRQLLGETEVQLLQKFSNAKAAGLIPILCLGETQSQRAAGLTQTVILQQLVPFIDKLQGSMVAYEPVWAIGTGLAATPEQAQQVHHLIRGTIAKYDACLAQALPILYGGSVKGDTTANLLAMPDIDGVLVGGASLEPKDFLTICEAAAFACMNSY